MQTDETTPGASPIPQSTPSTYVLGISPFAFHAHSSVDDFVWSSLGVYCQHAALDARVNVPAGAHIEELRCGVYNNGAPRTARLVRSPAVGGAEESIAQVSLSVGFTVESVSLDHVVAGEFAYSVRLEDASIDNRLVGMRITYRPPAGRF